VNIVCERVVSIDSTNAELLRRSSTQSIHAMALRADVQSSGRGQRGRAWHANVGDALLMSVGWAFNANVRLDGLSLAVGVAIAHATQQFAAGRLSLKWPNDLLLDDGAKLGGVLIETIASQHDGARSRYTVIGIGINIRPPPMSVLDRALALHALPAASLLSSLHPRTADGASIVCAALEQSILAELAQALPRFAEHGFAAFKDDWWSRRAYALGRVQLLPLDGETSAQHAIRGKIIDVAENGALIIDDGRTLHTLHSTSLSLRPIE
jgi:BirA family transcriptional regulator, biotin operon repressor / biotin---[acetyl-CoA-carboxylase] ligase